MTKKSYKSVKYVIEVDTFITLNIPTDTKKGLGQKIPPPPPPNELSLRLFFCVTRDLIEELGKTNRLPSRSSRSSTIIPCAITPNSRQVWGYPHISGRNKQNKYHNLIVVYYLALFLYSHSTILSIQILDSLAVERK